MRGSILHQIGTALDTITRIGQSKSAAKAAGLQNQFIHSVATRSSTGASLKPLAQYCKSKGIKDIEKLSAEDMKEYITDRLKHHISRGNTLKTFQSELSSIARFERGLTAFVHTHRQGQPGIDLTAERASLAKVAIKSLSRRATPMNRAYRNPMSIINAISDPVHNLQAKLQLEGGCRTEGVGAPAQSNSNPLTLRNLCNHKTGTFLGNKQDPITGEMKGVFWTAEKGGKIAYHFCSASTYKQLQTHLHKYEKLESKYTTYRKAIVKAAKETGQYFKGAGTHGLRFNFGQNRYDQAIRAGYTDEQAKLIVSEEMSHNRADITETYLK